MKKVKPAPSYVRRTLSLPIEVDQFASDRALNDHCGNLSAYLRVLILGDRKNHQKKTNYASQ